MFAKFSTTLLNLALCHTKLAENYLLFADNVNFLHPCMFEYPSEKVAAYAYGCIIHATLLGWYCVDITPEAIIRLMEKEKKTTT